MRAAAALALFLAGAADASGSGEAGFEEALRRAERALIGDEGHCGSENGVSERCRSYLRDIRFWDEALRGRLDAAYALCLRKFAEAPPEERFFSPQDLPTICAAAHPREPVRVCVLASVLSAFQPYDLAACVEDHRAFVGERCFALEKGSPARPLCLRAARGEDA